MQEEIEDYYNGLLSTDFNERIRSVHFFARYFKTEKPNKEIMDTAIALYKDEHIKAEEVYKFAYGGGTSADIPE